MKKTLFIIKYPMTDLKEVSFLMFHMASSVHSQVLLLNPAQISEWASIPNLMVVGQTSDDSFSSMGKTFNQVTYQGILEKIFDVDMALVI